MVGIWSTYSSQYLYVLGIGILGGFALPMLFVPIKFAQVLRWQIPEHEHLAIYFGRCLGGLAAVIAAFPVIVHQVWAFVLPALKKKEAKAGLALILSASCLFAAGLLFAYFAVMPYAFVFFLKSAQGIASPNISLAFYISFCSRMLLAFGTVFQMPLVIVFQLPS